MKLPISLIYMCVALMLAACAGKGDYMEFHDVATRGWSYIDALTFVPQRADSTAAADMSLMLRHDTSYPYSNLWLQVEYNDNGRPVSDTVNVTLADLYGRWTGSGFGTGYQMEVPVARGVTLANGDPVIVRHIMRVDTLKGIDRVGISLKAPQ